MKVKILTPIMILMIALFVSFAGCDEDTTLYFGSNDTAGYLQGVVFNALTMAPLEGVEITVMIGSQTIIATTEADGSYTMYGLPNGTQMFTATLAGYRTFRGTKNITDRSNIGNIRMFPIGIPTDALTIYVYDYDQNPVTGAIVSVSVSNVNSGNLLNPELPTGAGGVFNATNIISPTGDYPDNVVLGGTTDATGMVTIEATNLVLGAEYNIDVRGAVDGSGNALGLAQDSKWVAGSDHPTKNLFLDLLAATPIAISTNNIDETGTYDETLVTSSFEITFANAIELCSADADHGWQNRTTDEFTWQDTDGDAVISRPPATGSQVTATLSNNNETLTLEPIFGAGNRAEDTDDNLVLVFSGVEVKVAGTSDNGCTPLLDPDLPPYSLVNNDETVQIRSVSPARYTYPAITVRNTLNEDIPVADYNPANVQVAGLTGETDYLDIFFRDSVEYCTTSAPTAAFVQPPTDGGNTIISTLDPTTPYDFLLGFDMGGWYTNIQIQAIYDTLGDGYDGVDEGGLSDDTNIDVEFSGIEVKYADDPDTECVDLTTVNNQWDGSTVDLTLLDVEQ
jgi:hypothetical protein